MTVPAAPRPVVSRLCGNDGPVLAGFLVRRHMLVVFGLRVVVMRL